MTGATISREQLQQALHRVIDWVRANDYRAYEPADGNSSVLFPLTRGRIFPMRVLQQIVLRSPFNIRPILGVSRHESAIGRGYMAWSFLTLSRGGAPPPIRDEAVACLEWLIVNRAPGFGDFCWGDPYDYATRSGRRPFGAPILIWTALIGQAFLEAFDVLGDERYLDVAKSAGGWVSALPVEHTSNGSCLSYNAYKVESIHNSNAMGAAFLARLSAVTGDRDSRALAQSAMRYTCARQRADGSWFYGEEPKYHWIDNFHTGYNISALKTYRGALGDASFDSQLSKGLSYFKRNFFDADGRPKYFHDKTYPIDIQCAAQAIETLMCMSDDDPESLPLALAVANWTIRHMQAPDGHFHYRNLGWTTVTTPMLHWGQATMAKALAVSIRVLEQRQERDSDAA